MVRSEIKTIVTLGPASSDRRSIEAMITGGADVFRLNLSHADKNYCKETVRLIRAAERKLGKEVTIFFDLPGPKLRTGVLPGGKLQLVKGETYSVGQNADIPVSREILRQLGVKNRIFLSDGKIELKPVKKEKGRLLVKPIDDAVLLDEQSINSKNLSYTTKYPTEKDVYGINLGKSLGINSFAVSFPASAKDILAVRKLVGNDRNIIAKIERDEAVERFDDIASVSDIIMVARGDLGLNTDIAELPEVQRRLIRKANAMSKPVIIATQVLESMTTNPLPTRAEVNDAFSAIHEGTDALMLSEETAIGTYPLGAFRMLRHIIDKFVQSSAHLPEYEIRDEHDAIIDAAVILALRTGIRDVIVLTPSGRSASRLSRYRAGVRIFALTDSKHVLEKLRFSRDVIPVAVNRLDENHANMFDMVKRTYGVRKAIIVSGLIHNKHGTENIRIFES